MPAANPMMIAERGLTKPDAGVMATRPATAPDAAPSIVGLPVFTHSATIQSKAANDAAVWVATNALVAKPPALSAEPALNPNQPTHNMDAPITAKGRLCGGVATFPNPTRLPMIRTATRAEIPELMWTTVPPAKSSAPMVRNQPPVPQTQCARGS